MSKKYPYTPGPWKWDNAFSDGEQYRLTAPEADWKHRNVLESVDGCVYSEYSSDSSHIGVMPGNAQLIAAAPDLLVALQAALKSGIIDIDGEPAKAKAAIEKAIGATK